MIINKIHFKNNKINVYSYKYENKKIDFIGSYLNAKNKIINEKINIAIGGFDGFHLAHRRIVDSLDYENKKSIITFHPLPKFYFAREKHFNIYSLKEKIILAENEFKIDYMNIFILNNDFVNLKPEKFINLIIKYFNVNEISTGFNFLFGKNKSGNVLLLKEALEKYDIIVKTIPLIQKEGTIVSASSIRQMIKHGKIEMANKLLINPFFYFGKVTRGKQFGRKMGIPTANIKVSFSKIIPKFGVYLTKTEIEDKIYESVSYIGKCPTFSENRIKLETFIDNFSGNIYNKNIKVYLLKFLRNEVKFNSESELKKTILKDIKAIDNGN